MGRASSASEAGAGLVGEEAAVTPRGTGKIWGRNAGHDRGTSRFPRSSLEVFFSVAQLQVFPKNVFISWF